MAVRELLKKKPARVITVESTADVARAARLLMQHEIGGLPVVEHPGGSLVGFMSEREIVDALDRHPMNAHEVPVTAVMRKPAPVCDGEDAIRDVMERMTRDRLRHLVVLDDARIVGVISVGDLVRDRLEQLQVEAGVLRDYVAAHRAVK